ncbi:hypothetical protein JTB14_024875 [Gonioctena quinquepunctata]|nr:hypothetical protein JTB14_024875 [Gonioctena quinquepunctata]
MIRKLVHFYNSLLRGTMNVPEEWKTQTVIPTIKRDKDPNKYDSYRPLVLAPRICKLFESMLKNRIEHKLENEKFFGDMQTGFRKEGGESPLGVRRTWICTKYALKSIAYTGNKTTTMLINLYGKYNEEPLYWRNKAPPDMIEGLDLALQYKNQIETENGLPCFRADLETQITKLQWINSHITKGGIGSELDFKDLISRYPEHEIIYTDASIDHETGRSGIGVHSSTANLDLAERIQNGTTTCKAEILAIDRAITERTNNTDKLIIIADSRSALEEKITKSGINAKNDKITLNVRRKLIDAKARNKDIKLIWVPSHTGITGYERADKLANEGRGKQRTIQNKIHYTELYQNIKKYLKNDQTPKPILTTPGANPCDNDQNTPLIEKSLICNLIPCSLHVGHGHSSQTHESASCMSNCK